MSEEKDIKKIIELIDKYRSKEENNFDHQTIKIGDRKVFIHFHEKETEIHIINT